MKMLLITQRALLEGHRVASSANNNQPNFDPAAGDVVSNRLPFLNVRLPSINVPTFSGDRKSWRSFKDIFESTIHDRNDPKDSIKMQYLVSYLDGSAKQLFVDQPAVTTATSGSLRKLVTTSDEVVRQLNALGEEYGTRDPWPIYFLLEKLDKDDRLCGRSKSLKKRTPSFDDFIKFLDNRCDALETCTAFTKKTTTEAVKKEPSKKPASEKKMQSLHTAAQQAGEAAITSMVARVSLEPQQKSVVLPSAVIRVQGFDGCLLQVRALIDSGSEASLISEACVKKLGLSHSNEKLTVSGLGQHAAATTRGLVKLVMANRFTDACVLQTSAYVLGKLTSTLPTQQCRVHSSLLDKKIQDNLADPTYYQPGPIDIILGSDVFLALLKPGQVKDNGGVPVAQNTIFGAGPQPHLADVLGAGEGSELFRSTLTRDENGRFIVRLLFDDSKPAQGIPYAVLGVPQRIPGVGAPDELEVETSKCFYLPHHAVVKAESTTTKLRVGFDASCASSTGVSLNDRLLAGPNVNQDLFSVFLRFLTHPVTFSADVEKMLYRQVMVHPADRDYLRIDRSHERIELDTYVDNFLSGAQNVEHARKLKEKVVEILESAGFHLRKWTTNCSELLQEAPEDDQTPVKALGIQWLPKEDTFSFKVSLNPNSVNTKRQLLSDSCKLFDPNFAAWFEIKETLHQVEQIRIPRFAPNYNGKIELHGFADASELAYVAVVYARGRNEVGDIVVNLLVAKTRVAPIKQVSLTRLELNAAALLSTLMESTMQALSHLEVDLWAHTDSSIVLQWSSTHPRKWKSYVANRTSAILEVLPRDRWNHVRSENNPADCASRGLTPSELVTHPLWWHGPGELKTEADHWKQVPVETTEDEEVLKSRQVKVLHAAALAIRTNYDIENGLLERRSNYTLIVRTLAYVNRFLLAVKAEDANLEPGLSLNEIYDAKAQLTRAAQYASYKQELELLQKGKDLPAKHKLSTFTPSWIAKERWEWEDVLDTRTCRNLHAGPTLLTATVNQQYWVLGLQTAVRLTVQGCTRCVRLKGKTVSQPMGSLPVPRMMGTRAFTHVGVDYAGPLKVHASCVRGVKMTKAYIVVFVCMATSKCTASDLSTNMFICALKLFISRRSHPNEICATLWWYLGAVVKSGKKHLMAVLCSEAATFEKHSTILAQVEACLNSRPLCPLSSNPDSYEALTPGHFLVGQPMNLIPEPDVRHIPMNRLDKWQLLHKHTAEIWRRWRDRNKW
ncbi:uncharacterized protein LOC135698941 [Ochlerotatus camptorhynchus]|uniref:uncharacterized protein LOC135698941 n=1 Tax=Ochlerotatus camptorhynchus TaxID=644619 RepID=UPI0031CDCAD1